MWRCSLWPWPLANLLRIADAKHKKRRRWWRWALLALLLAQLVLWLLGPRDLSSGLYVQSADSRSAIVSLTEPGARRLEIWLRPEDTSIEAFRPGYPLPQFWARAGDPQPRRQRHWLVRGLRPHSWYRYELRAWVEPDRGPEQPVLAEGRFRTAPGPDPRARRARTRIAMFGDSGQLPWWHNLRAAGWDRLRPVLQWTQSLEQHAVARQLASREPDLFVHLGDLVYWPQVRGAMEDAFFRPLAPLLRNTSILSLVGNHDLPRDGSRPPFEELFRNPSPSIGAAQRNWTAVWGDLRVVGFDVYQDDWGPESPVVVWLGQQLAASEQPFVVVVQHRPVFSVYRPEDERMLEVLWPLYQRHGVNLVISGDDHHYARFKPRSGRLPVQVISGGGGKSLYEYKKSDSRLAASAKAFHFVEVEAEDGELRLRAIDVQGALLDEWSFRWDAASIPAAITAGRKRRIEDLLR